MGLHVCFIATEFFGKNSRGGFGAATRSIGSGLAKRGLQVSVVVPSFKREPHVSEVDGVIVHSHPIHEYPFTGRLYEDLGADIYHSEEPSWGTKIASLAVTRGVHVVTCQNPRTSDEWKLVYPYYPLRRRLFNFLMGESIRQCVKELDSVYCQARYIITKAKMIYELPYNPIFMPNPVKINTHSPKKPSEPTISFLGRFDPEKAPEIFFELARRNPSIRFVAAGMANDHRRDKRLRLHYAKIRNLELPGHLGEEDKSRLLDETWILVNTSVSECLPVSFLEASAHGCAILSQHDPDGFASSFGYHVREGRYDSGLDWLLEDERWKLRGEMGRRYVSEVHEFERVIDLHVKEYKRLLSKPHPFSSAQ